MTMWRKMMEKGKWTSVLVLGVLALTTLALTACGGKKAEQASSFTVGFDQEFPPMGFVAEDGSYTFVGPYMANKQVFVVKADSNISTLSDLAGKTVEVQKDSSGLEALSREENKSLKDSFSSLVEVGDYQSAMMDLETGACDAICMDSVVAEYQIKTANKPFVLLKDTLSAEEYGIGFKKGNTELAEKVKKTLLEMKADGTIDKITEKWFGAKDSFVLE